MNRFFLMSTSLSKARVLFFVISSALLWVCVEAGVRPQTGRAVLVSDFQSTTFWEWSTLTTALKVFSEKKKKRIKCSAKVRLQVERRNAGAPFFFLRRISTLLFFLSHLCALLAVALSFILKPAVLASCVRWHIGRLGNLLCLSGSNL